MDRFRFLMNLHVNVLSWESFLMDFSQFLSLRMRSICINTHPSHLGFFSLFSCYIFHYFWDGWWIISTGNNMSKLCLAFLGNMWMEVWWIFGPFLSRNIFYNVFDMCVALVRVKQPYDWPSFQLDHFTRCHLIVVS